MLYSVAILKCANPDNTLDAVDEVVYGPVNIVGTRREDTSMIASRVIAQAAAEGKLPGGWTSQHYVGGLSYSRFT